jgi:poly(A) polymerase/tRNA nucleotidyltransferase (CCA-adding enzyme)
MQILSLSDLLKLVPGYVINIAEELQKAGFEAYLVGGSLRDVLLGKEPSDFDVATNAYPEEIEKIFPKSIPTGAKFGTITVVSEDDNGEKFDVEVTTYRSEADYMGGRWPTKVEFTKTIKEDLARRDFTINAMALDLTHLDDVEKSGNEDIRSLIVDPFGGLSDLEDKVIRAVGDPIERFSEDGLRPMRACRIASQLEFKIDPTTFEAIKQTNHITKMVSAERIRDELMKLLLKSPKPSYGLQLMKDTGIMALVIPELLEGIDVTQPQFHVDDVFVHILKTVDAAEDEVKLAALFHDIAKPRTLTKDDKGIHFYGHDILGAEMTREIMTRLKFSNSEIERVSNLVRWHMFYYPSEDWRRGNVDKRKYREMSKDEIKSEIEKARNKNVAGGWSDGAIRRFIANVGGEENMDQLLKLRIADAVGNPMSDFNPQELDVLAERIAEVRAKDMALKVSDLDITGEDLMRELNLQPGPKLGEILNHLLDQVLEDPLKNEKSQLLELARSFVNSESKAGQQ